MHIDTFVRLASLCTARIFLASFKTDPHSVRSMLFKLFRKNTESRPRFEQDASTAEALQRRVEAIKFQPSKGFLKDQRQPKRAARRPTHG
jgi:uncharacterized iron-regulated protein